MNEDKFMPELNLKQPGFVSSACGPFIEHCERILKFKTGNLKHLCRNKLAKVCFAHDAAYFDSKDLAKWTIPDKILKDRACKIARNRDYDGCQRASMIHKIFDKKTRFGLSVNEELAEELHKPV